MRLVAVPTLLAALAQRLHEGEPRPAHHKQTLARVFSCCGVAYVTRLLASPTLLAALAQRLDEHELKTSFYC